jgi:BatD DUF11 like domain
MLREMSIFRASLLTALMALAHTAFADPPKVTAVLSNSEPPVGQMVQLDIKVSGAKSAIVPQEISVNGLEIHQTGTSQQFEMRNFDVNSSVTYSYSVLPLQAGTFRIPPQIIHVNGTTLRTPELTLTASNTPNRSAGTARSGQTIATQIASAELVVPKQTAYVGEMIPVEIRLRLDARAHPQLIEPPILTGQGFTAQKISEPQESVQQVGGRTYQVATFKTAISAARTGKFEIGPVQTKLRVSLPRQAAPSRPRPRSPFDLFDMDDPFSDFFGDAFGHFAQRTDITVKSEPATLEVKPLPPNAPPNFSGAVGNFTMTAEAKPDHVQVGDPITVTSSISGRGNFDRMTSPSLESEQGWHKYPPSSKFKQDDDIGISGEKTFEMVISPEEKKPSIPPLVFCYFDPAKENYVTLRSDSVPIVVQGGAAPPVAAASPTASQPAATAAAPKSPPKPRDILYQLTETGPPQSFRPLYSRPVFWAAQIVPLVLLVAFAGWKRQGSENREAQRLAQIQNESDALLRTLRRNELPPDQYFANASRAVRLKTALVKNVDPNVVDAEMAVSAFNLGEPARTRLHQLFERSDELRYSGRPNGAISADDRREVLKLIESLRA